MSSAEKPVKNKLGTRFNWQPARTEAPAEAAIERLTAPRDKASAVDPAPSLLFPTEEPVLAEPAAPAISSVPVSAPPRENTEGFETEELSPSAPAETLPVKSPPTVAPETVLPPVEIPASPALPDEAERLRKLNAEVTDLRWWAFLSTMVCLMVLLSWLV